MKLLIFRTILIYLCVLFSMRLMGKRQLGELQPEELVSTILISNLASISIESEEVPVTASLIPLFLIAALELLGSILSFRSQRFFNLMSGRPKTVILDGQIDQNALRMLRLTVTDLMEALRGKDIFDPRDVSYAVIETNGNLSVALRPEREPARLADLQLKTTQTNATIPFVLDGQVLEDPLHWCGKNHAWLERTAEANTVLISEIYTIHSIWHPKNLISISENIISIQVLFIFYRIISASFFHTHFQNIPISQWSSLFFQVYSLI